VRTAYATFIRNWIVTRRAYPWSFFFGALLSGLITVALAYFTYHALASGQLGPGFTVHAGTSDYMSYIILGASMYLLSVRVFLGVSRSLITERREGTFFSLLLTPTRRSAYFVGVAAQWIAISMGEMAILLLITWPLGLNLSHIQLLTFVLVVPVAILGLFGMSILLGAIMLVSGDTYIVQNTLFIAMALLCGFSFPPDYLPLPLQWLSATLPVTGTLHLLRAALLQGGSPQAVLRDLGLYTILGVIYTISGFWLMQKAERQVLEGTA